MVLLFGLGRFLAQTVEIVVLGFSRPFLGHGELNFHEDCKKLFDRAKDFMHSVSVAIKQMGYAGCQFWL